MRIIFDATWERRYPIASDGLTSGTVRMVREVAAGLAGKGHTVHVVCNDLQQERELAPRLWGWPVAYHPTAADVLVCLQDPQPAVNYDAPVLVLATIGIDPNLGPNGELASAVEAYPVLSPTHARLLRAVRPAINPQAVQVIGLGVDMADYSADAPRVLDRLLWASSPDRGLWHMLDVFDEVRKRRPRATLHVAYDFARHLPRAWAHDQLGQYLWECYQRMNTPGVTMLPALSHADIVREQLECQVFAYPCDPVTQGSELFCLAALEAAAAGSPLVLSEADCLPEVYGSAATVLPAPGAYRPDLERRIDAADWAEVIVELMAEPVKWREASRKARDLAQQHTWEAVVERWDVLLGRLAERAEVKA